MNVAYEGLAEASGATALGNEPPALPRTDTSPVPGRPLPGSQNKDHAAGVLAVAHSPRQVLRVEDMFAILSHQGLGLLVITAELF